MKPHSVSRSSLRSGAGQNDDGSSPDLPDGLSEAAGLLASLARVFFPGDSVFETLGQTGPWRSGPQTDTRRLALEDRYRILVEQIPAIVFMAYLDRGMSEAYVSPQIEALLGFTQEEWLNDPVRWFRHIHPEDKGRWSVEAAQMLTTGAPIRSVYRVLSRNGDVLWFQCEVEMVRDEEGHPWFLHGVAFDITDLKRAEEGLRESEHRLRGLFESAPDTVVVVDQEGHIDRINAQVERMFGYTPQELAGRSVEVLLPERFRSEHSRFRSDYVADPHTRPMGAGLQLYGLRKDGTEFPVDVMLSPMRTPTGSLVIAVVRDITSRKRTEETLRRSEEELRALTANLLSVQDEERRRIAREMHDGMAQNLAGLAMNLSLLMNALADVDDPVLRARLAESVELAEQCSREVRSLSYILHPPLLDDLGLASALRSYIAGFSQRTHVEVDLDLPSDLKRLAPEVETALFRIVQESLANVDRHSDSSRAAIRLTVSDEEVWLRVTDEGRGITPGDGRDLDSDEVHLGVGIPGMRERAQQLGGRMEFASTPEGTTVIVTLPVRSRT